MPPPPPEVGAPPLDRAAFPVTERWTYLNHAGTAPLPLPAVEAMHACALTQSRGGSLAWDAQAARCEEVRAGAADLMGVRPREVAFVKNTTEGLGFVASGLAWEPGDRVIVPDLDFPSTVYPWLAQRDRGVVVDLVPPVGPGRTLPVEAFAEAISAGSPPRLVATSWVQYGRGWRTDLAALSELCHQAGALLCVDVIQGLGVLPADLAGWGVDFAMADGHKWLLGPEGVGVLYVRSSRLDLLRPLEPGWASVSHRESWDDLSLDWDSSARRLEGGTLDVAAIAALGASLDLLAGAGPRAVWDHVEGLCDRACAGLEDAGARVLSERSGQGRSGIVTFEVPGRGAGQVVDALGRLGVVCSARGGGVRISPHAYNDTDEIGALVEVVAGLAGA